MRITSSQTPSFHGRREPGTRLRKSTVWRLSSYNRQVNGFREGEIEKKLFFKGGLSRSICALHNYNYYRKSRNSCVHLIRAYSCDPSGRVQIKSH